MRWYCRPAARSWTCAPAPDEVAAFHASLPGYAPTPLVELPSLAGELGVGRVFVKDESFRLGLPAFKILGVSWALHRAEPASGVRLVAATDGNHGRALARAARLRGHAATIYTPDGVHPAAVAAISGEGATVTAVRGTYDQAVLQAARDATRPATLLVQDTAWPGYERIPAWIVEGYSTMFAEIDRQLELVHAAPPALVAVPVGVGSLAQAAVTHYRSRPDGPAPALLSVEPVAAACLLESLTRRRQITLVTGRTSMAGLNCGTPSALAWPYLRGGLDAAITVTDAAAAVAAGKLAALGVSSGPCGAAALAGARAALTEHRDALPVGPDSTLVLISTEGRAANPA
ncbi:pyridoxal-phosphate dependent enzyme [Spongiactinospora rosea]|nr:pyridoxal-phosphate dependent enzyme [Spongiactinospora rosea]